MNDLPQAQFNQLLSTYGSQLCEEQQRCEALLRDTFPEYPRQVSLLVNALKQGVPQDLLASHNKIPFEVTRSRLARKLADEMFVQQEAAQWVVDSWSEALGMGAAARPGTVMQPPEVSGGTGNTPPGAFAPTMMRPSDSGNMGNLGNMGNSGNYNNPANYNPPASSPYGTPVNYAAGTVMTPPTSGQPQVWVWFIVYCVLMLLLCLSYLFTGAVALASDEGNKALGILYILMSCIGLVLYAAAPFLPKARWAWIYDIVMICIGIPTCCCTPASIPLLIFWLKPEVKSFFNVPNS
jgi:hypothetical protein